MSVGLQRKTRTYAARTRKEYWRDARGSAEVSDRESNKVGACFKKQTEREGFEPSVELPLHQFSRLTP